VLLLQHQLLLLLLPQILCRGCGGEGLMAHPR
jgi:hypothetical protein